jgi:hypothetical protein
MHAEELHSVELQFKIRGFEDSTYCLPHCRRPGDGRVKSAARLISDANRRRETGMISPKSAEPRAKWTGGQAGGLDAPRN